MSGKTLSETEEKQRKNDKDFGAKIWILYVIAYGLLCLYTLTASDQPHEIFLGLVWKQTSLLIVTLILLSFFSFGIMEQGELGVHIILGRVYKDIQPGIFFKIPLLSKITRMPSLVIKDDYPGPSKKIWKGEMDAMPENGNWVLPLLVTTGADVNVDGDPLNNRLTVKVLFFARYRVIDPISFYKEMGGSMDELRDQIEGAVIAQLKVEFAKHTMANILKHLAEINEILTGTARGVVRERGIEVLDIQIEDVNGGKRVNEGLISISTAQSRAKGTHDEMVMVADGEKYKRIKEAEGDANGIFTTKEAEAEGNKRLAAVAETPGGKITLAMDVAKAFNATTTKVVVLGNQGVAGLVTQGKAILEAMEETK